MAREHAKGYTVIVAGDINMTLNTKETRVNPTNTFSHKEQHILLEKATEMYGLTDTFTHKNKGKQYKTWGNTTGTWSSPDHILVSDHIQQDIKSSKVVEIEWSDHNSIYTDISIVRNISAKRDVAFCCSFSCSCVAITTFSASAHFNHLDYFFEGLN